MENLLQDLRFSLRWLRRSPGFTIAAIATLGIGIGANSAIFTLVNSILLRPLPYPEPARLVRVWAENPKRDQVRANVNPLDFADFRREAKSAELTAMSARAVSLLVDGDPERLRGALVEGSFFRLLGAGIAAGRAFTAEEERPGAPDVAMISHELWQRRFHGAAGTVGRSVPIDDKPTLIVGILKPGFRPPGITERERPMIYQPLRIQDSMGRGGHWLRTFARLAPGATAASGQAELSGIASRLEKEYSGTNSGWTVRLEGLKQSEVGNVRTSLLILFISVALVLLIACSNVANLLLARAAARRHEVVLRNALGADRGRIVRQLLTESVVLALAGGLLGLALGWAGLRSFALLLGPETLPRFQELSLDLRVVLFTLGIAVATGLIFGLAPAYRAARATLGTELRQGERGAGRRLPAALIVGQLAVALVLLIGAGLLIKSFSRLLKVDPGFRPENRIAIDVDLPGSRYGESAQMSSLFERLLERASALPQVEAATAVDILPFSSGFNCSSFTAPDLAQEILDQVPCVEYRVVAPGYFETLGIPIRSGRSLAARDAAGAPLAVVVNEKLARALWQDKSPLGRSLTLGFEEEAPHSIVGVAGDVHHFGLGNEAAPEIYVTYLQHPTTPMTVVLKTPSTAEQMTASMRSLLRDLDPQLPLGQVEDLPALISDSVAAPRLRTLLLTLFAAFALLLAAIGIFGVVAYSVAQRTREIGIRMALGADRGRVKKLIVGQTMAMAAVGLALGLGGAFASTRLLASSLYGIGSTDPSVFLIGVAVLAAATLAACYLPARRASRLEPTEALRTL